MSDWEEFKKIVLQLRKNSVKHGVWDTWHVIQVSFEKEGGGHMVFELNPFNINLKTREYIMHERDLVSGNFFRVPNLVAMLELQKEVRE